GGGNERQAEERRLPHAVLEHPHPPQRDLRGPDTALRLEEPRVEHRHLLDAVSVLRGEGRELRPGDVGVRGGEGEVEGDHGVAAHDDGPSSGAERSLRIRWSASSPALSNPHFSSTRIEGAL